MSLRLEKIPIVLLIIELQRDSFTLVEPQRKFNAGSKSCVSVYARFRACQTVNGDWQIDRYCPFEKAPAIGQEPYILA